MTGPVILDANTRARIRAEAERIFAESYLPTLPDDALIRAAGRAYEAAHAATRGREWVEASDNLLALADELERRLTPRCEAFMERLLGALETGDLATLAAIAAEFQTWPAVARRWAFAYFRPDRPEYEGALMEWNLEPIELTDEAVALRTAR